MKLSACQASTDAASSCSETCGNAHLFLSLRTFIDTRRHFGGSSFFKTNRFMENINPPFSPAWDLNWALYSHLFLLTAKPPPSSSLLRLPLREKEVLLI